MAVYVVTGASRGIGIEFVRQLLARGDEVIATCRSPSTATALQDVVAGGRGTVLALDVASEESIAALAVAMERWPAIDGVIHNAGISAPTHPVDPVAGATKQAMMDCFATNAVGPLLLCQSLFPKLRAGRGKRIFMVSTNMASMASTTSGGSVSYRSSKSALNMVGRCLAGEHGPQTRDGFLVTLCHPGWVNTDMGSAGNRAPPVSPPGSVRGMLGVMDAMGPHSAGDFLEYTGEALPW